MSSSIKNKLPDGWEIKPLGDIVRLQNGFAFKRSLYKESGAPIVRIKNIKNERIELDDIVCFNPIDYKKNLDQYKIKENDILIAMSGATTGKIGLYNRNDVAYLNQRVGLFRIENNDLRRYLFYFLSTQVEDNLLKSLGAAQPNLSSSQINEMETPIPPLEEHKRIVAKIDTLFAKIDKAISLTEESLKQAKNLLPSVLKEVFEKGKADGWEEKKVGQVCKVINGRAYKKTELLSEGKYKVLRVGNLFTNNSWYWSDLELKEDKYISNGDLIYAWSASFGPRVWSGDKVIYHYHIWKIVNGIEVSKEFLYHWLDWKTKTIKKENTSGTTMIHVTKGMMESLVIQYPNIAEQKDLVSRFNTISEISKKTQSKLEEQLGYLKQLKSSILSKAFKGEL